MLATFKSAFKWMSPKSSEKKKNPTSLLLIAFVGILEDVLYWKKLWLSLLFIFLFHLIYFVCVYRQVSVVQFVLCSFITILTIDAFETWLKYKHRTACLKRLADQNVNKIRNAFVQMNSWLGRRWVDFIVLREKNHTKAFLLVEILLCMLFFIAKYTSGYVLIYITCMFLFFLHKITPPIKHLINKVKQNAESDTELEGLIPELSEANLELLSIEPEIKPVIDERQSLEYWKPVDISLEEASDSSENSTSLVTNLSMEKMQTLERSVENSDSSEDEYMPQVLDQQIEQFQTSLEIQTPSTWSSAAYNVFSNISGAVTNMVYTASSPKEDKIRKRISSADSSDGFEIIDKYDILS